MTKHRDELMAQLERFDRAPTSEGVPAAARLMSQLLEACDFTPEEMQELAATEPAAPGALSAVVRKMVAIADQVEAFKPRRVEYTVKETAAAIRKALRAQFPGVQFSVRMSRGTAYGWLDVSYQDGPVSRDVDEITRAFQDQKFDGMDDSYHSVAPSTVLQDGEMVELAYSCRGANSARRITPAGASWAAEQLNRIDPRDFDWLSTEPRDWRSDAAYFVGSQPLDHCSGYSWVAAPIDIAAGWARHYSVGSTVTEED